MLHLMCNLCVILELFIQKLSLFKTILRAKQYSSHGALTYCWWPEKSAKPEAFCREHFGFSAFVLLTSPQLVQLKTLFHHMLSRSSSAAENAAKNLSAGFTVRMSCFTSNLSPIWYSLRKQRKPATGKALPGPSPTGYSWGIEDKSSLAEQSYSHSHRGIQDSRGFLLVPPIVGAVSK